LVFRKINGLGEGGIIMGLPKRSAWAWGWFWIWTAPAMTLAVIASLDPDWGVPPMKGWDTRSAIQLFELLGLLIISMFMHGRDEAQKAAGFLYFYRLDPRTTYEAAEGALRGLLTVQSIRSALTLGALLALLSRREDLLGQVSMNPEGVVGTPPVVFFVLAVAGLSGSALTTLAAIQSYDYALRFSWPEPKDQVKLEFVKKAHRFGVIGFYCLMWSLTAAAALAGTLVGLIATSAVFVVMWYYYYFTPLSLKTKAERAVQDVAPDARNTAVARSSLRRSLGKKDDELVTLAEQWTAVREGLDVLEKLLPKWARSDVQTTREIGDKIVGQRG
jgi:hypothetical protein